MNVNTWSKESCEWMLSKDLSDDLRTEIEEQLKRIK